MEVDGYDKGVRKCTGSMDNYLPLSWVTVHAFRGPGVVADTPTAD